MKRGRQGFSGEFDWTWVSKLRDTLHGAYEPEMIIEGSQESELIVALAPKIENCPVRSSK